MAFTIARNMCYVVAYLRMSIILNMLVLFFIDVLFGADLSAVNIETLAYALDAVSIKKYYINYILQASKVNHVTLYWATKSHLVMYYHYSFSN